MNDTRDLVTFIVFLFLTAYTSVIMYLLLAQEPSRNSVDCGPAHHSQSDEIGPRSEWDRDPL